MTGPGQGRARTSGRRRWLRGFLLPVLLLAWAGGAIAQSENASGRELMERVYNRHQQYPYVYEEQSMILIDRDGNRETRTLRRYSRMEPDRSVRFLLVFDSPREVRGVALLASRTPSGVISKSIYLPAVGGTLIESGGGRSETFLGTDFSVENLTGEVLDEYRYVRRRDQVIDDLEYFLVDVYPAGADVAGGQPVKRHYILQDNDYITRTDYVDELGRVRKRRTQHDLNAVDTDMWRSNMILMEDLVSQHRTLIKIDRRVFSHDYVPAEVFTREWLLGNHPPLESAAADTAEDGANTAAGPEQPDGPAAQETEAEDGA